MPRTPIQLDYKGHRIQRGLQHQNHSTEYEVPRSSAVSCEPFSFAPRHTLVFQGGISC